MRNLDPLMPVTILVSCAFDSPYASEVLNSILRSFGESMFASIERAGGEVRFVEASAPNLAPDQLIAGSDGLLLLGGADIDPALYGCPPEVDTLYGVNPTADLFELDLLHMARARGLPVLGICRGMQLINIGHGGTLIQEIGPTPLHNKTSENSVLTDHEVTLSEGSCLAKIYNGRPLQVRSGHHQAVGLLAKGFCVAALAPDGLIEAIETKDSSWVLGVQWHPEDPQAPRDDLDFLVHEFIGAIASRRSSVNRRAKLTPHRRPKLTPRCASRSGTEPTELIML